MKILAAVMMVLALIIGIVPQFTNCEYARSMTTSSTTMAGASTSVTVAGMSAKATVAPTSKSKCLWTARAEIAVAVSLFAIGAFLFFSRRKESRRALSVLAILEGLLAILLPTVLIGLCTMSTMTCRTEMQPTLYAAGGVVIAVGLASLVWNEMRPEARA